MGVAGLGGVGGARTDAGIAEQATSIALLMDWRSVARGGCTGRSLAREHAQAQTRRHTAESATLRPSGSGRRWSRKQRRSEPLTTSCGQASTGGNPHQIVKDITVGNGHIKHEEKNS